MLTDKNRKHILNQHLSYIYGISSKEYQGRVWIRAEGPEWDTFDETCCHFFDDGDPILEHYRDFGISESQYQILKELRDRFYAFSRLHRWPPDFIDMPEWDEITKMAAEVLKAFDYKI